MRRFCLVAGMVLAMGCVVHAHAHTFTYDLDDGTAAFSIDFPDGWRLDLDFEPAQEGLGAPPPPRVVEAIPKDGSRLWLGTWVLPDIASLDEAREYFESLEKYILNDVSIEQTSEESLNDMPARVLRGSAKKGSEPVEWVMALFQPKDEIIAGILYIGVPEARQLREAELRSILKSVQPPG